MGKLILVLGGARSGKSTSPKAKGIIKGCEPMLPTATVPRRTITIKPKRMVV